MEEHTDHTEWIPDRNVREIARDCLTELGNSYKKFNNFNSLHEGYAVILEEVDELWDEIKKKDGERDLAEIKQEATQVAAMAMKLLIYIKKGPENINPQRKKEQL